MSKACWTTALLIVLVLGCQVLSAETIGYCVQRPTNATEQICTLIEDWATDILPGLEPPIVAQSLFGPDLRVGFWTIFEPDQVTISDYVVFPDKYPGTGGTDEVRLYSANESGDFPTGILDGLTSLGVLFESPPEPCIDCVVSFDQTSVGGLYTDTFNIISDPSPEPATFLLMGGPIVLLLGLWRRGHRQV